MDDPATASCSSSPSDETETSNYLSALLSKYFKDCGSERQRILAQCLSCGSKIKASSQASSNLITHLKRCNPKRYCEYIEEKRVLCSEKKRKTHEKNIGQQVTMHSFFKAEKREHFRPNDLKQRRMVKALLFSIACDQLPLSLIESPSFRDFVHEGEPKFVFPARTTIRNALLPHYITSMENELRLEMKELDRIYLTLDLWTNRQMTSFLGFTVHFVNRDWDLKSRVLGCDIFEGRHTAVNIASAYEDIVTRFNIQGKVKKIVADNASSMLKAFDVSLPSFYIDQEDAENLCNPNFVDEDEDACLQSVLSFLPQRMGCFAHSQQLCVRDGFAHSEVKKSIISATLQKIASLINSIKKSTVAAPYLRSKGIVLQTQNATRWNSQLKMVKSILKNPVEVNNAIDLLSQKEQRNKKIMPVEISALKELVTVLEPFEEALEVVEGQKKVTITAIGPVIQGLTHSLEHLIHTAQLQYCEKLTKVLLDSVRERLDPYMEIKDVQVAALLDPRFKLNWISSQQQKDQVLAYAKEMLEAEVAHKEKNSAREKRNTYDLAQGLPENPELKRPKLFSFLPGSPKAENQQGSEGSTMSNNFLLKQYVEEGTQPFFSDPLLYWKEAPHAMNPLKNLARDILGCTAISAPSQRVFSIAGNYFTANRAQLGVSSFRSMIMIKCNSELFTKLPASAVQPATQI